MSRHPFHGRQLTPGGVSSASGRYQAMGDTWAEAARTYGLRDFSPISQDIFAIAKLADRGILQKVAAGNIDSRVKRQLGMEWASFEGNPYGQGTGTGLWSQALPFFKQRQQVYSNSATNAPTINNQQTATQVNKVKPNLPSTPQEVNNRTPAPTRSKRRQADLFSSLPAVDSRLLKDAISTKAFNLNTVEQMVAATRVIVDKAMKQTPMAAPVAIRVATNRRQMDLMSTDTACTKSPTECVQAAVTNMNQVNVESFVFSKEWISFTGMDSA
jgi:hypothetical protein